MKPTLLSLTLALCLGTSLAHAATGAQSAAAANAAELARAQASAAKLASEHARVAAEHAAIGARQARHLVSDDDGTPMSEAEALAIAALRGLMAAPPERALPLVRKVLEGDQTARVKERAVFVLAQIEGAEAAALLKRTAQQAGQGRMQLQAVRALGIRGDADSLETLKSLYPSGDAGVRDAVLQSLMIANDRKGLYDIVRQARDEEEAHRAIQLLALAGGREELRALAQSGVHARNLVDAFAISNDFDGLIALARDDRDPKVQRDAVSQLGLVGDARASEALRDFYRKADREEIRQAALQGMMIAGDEQGLLALYRAETRPERKRELLQTLTMIGGDAAFEAIDAALDGKSP
jgi:HEAT repeat protein